VELRTKETVVGDEINSSPKFYRRKKRFQGATWTPNTSSAAPEDGAWCARCRQRHGYKSSGLLMQVEKASDGNWRILWVCKKTGNVLEIMGLSRVWTKGEEA
jgi:hypothetical protein